MLEDDLFDEDIQKNVRKKSHTFHNQPRSRAVATNEAIDKKHTTPEKTIVIAEESESRGTSSRVKQENDVSL